MTKKIWKFDQEKRLRIEKSLQELKEVMSGSKDLTEEKGFLKRVEELYGFENIGAIKTYLRIKKQVRVLEEKDKTILALQEKLEKILSCKDDETALDALYELGEATLAGLDQSDIHNEYLGYPLRNRIKEDDKTEEIIHNE